MQRRWKIAFGAAGIAVVAVGLAVLLVRVSGGRPVAGQRAIPVRYVQRPVVRLGTGRRRMQRRWKMTLAGVGMAVAAAGLSVLLVVLLPGARPVARQRAVPVMYMGHPVPV